jgi:hypothetical protein
MSRAVELEPDEPFVRPPAVSKLVDEVQAEA